MKTFAVLTYKSGAEFANISYLDSSSVASVLLHLLDWYAELEVVDHLVVIPWSAKLFVDFTGFERPVRCKMTSLSAFAASRYLIRA